MYTEPHDDAHEAREKLLDLIESTRTNAAEIERLQKERDDAQQWIDLLEGELRGEEDLNAVVEAVTTRLTVEVSQCQE